MELVSCLVGYRLSMMPERSYRLEQSVQVYMGLIGKMMIALNFAFRQRITDFEGRTVVLAVNKKSLGHFVWRHNRYCDADKPAYELGMRALYKVSHQFWNKDYKLHRSFIREMSFQLKERNLFKAKMRIQDFLKVVKEQAPLRGCFYKIRKDDKTVGYLLGTMHVGNDLFLNLNPKINKALRKSPIVAGEQSIDDKNHPIIQIRPELAKKKERFRKILNESCNQAGLQIHKGLESCIQKKIREMGQAKEFVALEKKDETERDVNLFFEQYNRKETSNGKGLYRIFRRILAGDEESAIKDINAMQGAYKESLVRRNHAMVDRSDPLMQRERTFMAVGFLHLHSEQGMKAMLEQKGYCLNRII